VVGCGPGSSAPEVNRLGPYLGRAIAADQVIFSSSATAGRDAFDGLEAGEVLGCEPSERSLRFGLERSYRALARRAPERRRRIELVDMANDVRPRAWS